MPYRMVIIDDEPWTRAAIKNLAQASLLELEVVGEAADGEAGLILIERVHPDIILADVNMPRINGLELVKQLREKGNAAPVLIISGYDEFDYVRSALKLGVTDYLLKPIKAHELNQQLRRCIEIIKEKPAQQPHNVLQADFFADGWQSGYDDILQKIITALHVGNQDVITEQFERLRVLVCDLEGQSPDNAAMIGIYYAVMNPLQKYLEDQKTTQQEVFMGKNTIYVFGPDSTLQQMLDFVLDLYLTALRQTEKRRQMSTPI